MQPAVPALVQRFIAVPLALPGLCLLFLLLFSGPTLAQGLQRGTGTYTLPTGSMPSWTVPVLRLVSSTHVEPTTGIVISDTGLVLVPEDFASMGDEIIVLDGGTDIIRNGRPARIERKFTAEGLQVLYVEGLKRRGVTIASGLPAEGSDVVLTAFPPAEQIAQGEPPLSVKAPVVIFEETGNPAIAGETRLPNVTGGLVDACGNLVGISVADDVQSMEPSPATRYQWRKTLLYILAEMQVTPRESDCSSQSGQPIEEVSAEETPMAEPGAVPEPEEPAADEAIIPEEEPPVAEEILPGEPLTAGEEEEEPTPEILPPVEQDAVEDGNAGEKDDAGNWPWLLAALVLFGLGFVLHRLRRSSRGETGSVAGSAVTESIPGLQGGEDETDIANALPDSLLVVRGVLADGSGFEASCPVSEHAINVTIGRGDSDLIIESQAVSRRHVNLNGTRRELTVSDLGSSNGTSINGVPCLEGEIMFIEAGDELVLGDARCTIEIKPRNTPGGGKK
jgi:hypothetical protein